MKKVVVISASLRNGSNSEILAKKLVEGAKAANHDVVFITLKNKNLKGCVGCLSCQKTEKCVIKDDVYPILEEVKNADVLVFATPVYYYGMSGTLKNLLDRMNPLYKMGWRNKEIYEIMTCADDDPNCLERVIQSFDGWITCFDNVVCKGVVRGYGLNDPQEIKKHKEMEETAYIMGKSI